MSFLNSRSTADSHPLQPAFAKNTPNDRRGLLDWVTISLILITTFAYFARCAIKLFQKRSVTRGIYEEVLLLFAWAFSVIQGALLIRANASGFGTRHPIDQDTALQWYYASQLIAVISVACSKLAVITFIIWSMKPQGKLNAMAWTTFSFGIVYAAAGIFGTAFQCSTPLTWLVTPTNCSDQAGILTTVAALNVLSDLLIIFLPVPIVLKLQFMAKTRRNNRIILLSVFLARFVVVALAVGFAVSFNQEHDLTQPTISDVHPVLWNQGVVFMSTIATCLPAMFSFLKFMASGAMGIRIGHNDTQLKSFSASPRDFSQQAQQLSGRSLRHGTTTQVKGGKRLSGDDTTQLVPDDGIAVLTEVRVESSHEVPDTGASSEKSLSNYLH